MDQCQYAQGWGWEALGTRFAEEHMYTQINDASTLRAVDLQQLWGDTAKTSS